MPASSPRSPTCSRLSAGHTGIVAATSASPAAWLAAVIASGSASIASARLTTVSSEAAMTPARIKRTPNNGGGDTPIRPTPEIITTPTVPTIVATTVVAAGTLAKQRPCKQHDERGLKREQQAFDGNRRRFQADVDQDIGEPGLEKPRQGQSRRLPKRRQPPRRRSDAPNRHATRHQLQEHKRQGRKTAEQGFCYQGAGSENTRSPRGSRRHRATAMPPNRPCSRSPSGT